MTRSVEEVRLVLDLDAANVRPREISRLTEIPRPTVCRWLSGQRPTRTRAKACMRCTPERFSVFRRRTESAYAYLLGVYLGDGCLTTHSRGVFRLEITMDAAYPRIIAECQAATSLAMPPCLFPQHGPGHKHRRRIALLDWQRAIADRYPDRLLRGLIHSDGCRAINTIKHPKRTYRYSRYQFSNRSADIRAIFCEYCDKLSIEWRQMNRFNISVARAESVARMDGFIGPKR